MKVIPLTQGYVAWVDDEDYAFLAGHKWYAHTPNGHTYYAKRNVPVDPRPGHRRKQTGLFMHRAIMNPGDGYEVDHRIHHPEPYVIDNRRSNLRIVTRSQNSRGKRKISLKSSIFKGVSLFGDRWHAQLCQYQSKTNNHIGFFETEVDAAFAYDRAAIERYGDYAVTNFAGEASLYGPLPLSPISEFRVE